MEIIENYKLKNIDKIIENINNFFIKIQSNNFIKYKKQFKSFDKKKLGKSGSIIGIINNNKIMKHTIINKKIKKYVKISNNTCIKIIFPLNEIYINIILNNLPKLVKYKKLEKLEKYKNNFIKIYDYGIYNNNIFIISEKIGFENINNLNDIFRNNYIPKLLYFIKNDKYELLRLLIKFIVEKIEDYLGLLLLLNKHIGFVHSDLKLENVFVRYNNNSNKKYRILKENDIIIDYILLISDLDKSVLEINKIQTIPYITNLFDRLKNKILFMKTKINRDIRFRCKTKKYFCSNFKSYKFDILTLFINILGILIYNFDKIKLDKNKIKKILNPFLELLKKKLKINTKNLEILFNIIYKNKKNKYYFIEYDIMINNFCNKIN
jgi:serine/threonine protein kinase